jgi:uncharacterized protein with PIN domain
METKFIADNNVGKLARWLRLMGYDTLLFREKDDNQMIQRALSENRVILTKDAQFMRRRLVTDGKIGTIHIKHDDPRLQVQEVVKTLKLDYHFKPFRLCLECNQRLAPRSKEEVQNLVPARVLETQTQYTWCPGCQRIYWPGTHWRDMVKKLQDWQGGGDKDQASI